MTRMTRYLLAVGAVIVLSSTGLAMTAEEILERVEEQGLLGLGAGDFQGEFSLTTYEPDEEPQEYRFRVWGREEEDGTVKTTILYAYPELIEGTVFLFHAFPEEDPRLWLMLPEVGDVIELVGARAEGEFVAGIGITYEELAHGFTYRNGYESELLDEEELDGDPCWKLQVKPLDLEDADWASILLWVHQANFVVMRADFEDEDGEIGRRITAAELEEDELGAVARLLVVEDLKEDVRAEIRIEQRSREKVAEEVFIPERLPELEL
ncbi:MAG: outer membrane lipoprotein-sorting protein [Candidatus Bipolaricaulota bacterium]